MDRIPSLAACSGQTQQGVYAVVFLYAATS
jgi:hypothetical protein